MKLIGCDVDGVVVSPPWAEWLLENPHRDVLDFWRASNLYDSLAPIPGAVLALQEIGKNFDVVFISKLKGYHHASKVKFLKRFFPFMVGFIGTHEKFLLNDSLIAHIDDNMGMLKGFELQKRVLFYSDIIQDSYCDVGYVIPSWEDFNIDDFCVKYG